ncbi:MAG: hypothetical protein JJU40_05625 [Rhodobacteraceae bacterium]|nr:hypothetical protein [Paracoccaceae bacterium]
MTLRASHASTDADASAQESDPACPCETPSESCPSEAGAPGGAAHVLTATPGPGAQRERACLGALGDAATGTDDPAEAISGPNDSCGGAGADHDIPLCATDAILGTLASEIAHLARIAEQVDGAERSPATGRDTAGLQQLDLLRQSLAALAGYVDLLARQAAEARPLVPADAARAIPLGAMRARLSHPRPGPASPQGVQPGGAVSAPGDDTDDPRSADSAPGDVQWF